MQLDNFNINMENTNFLILFYCITSVLFIFYQYQFNNDVNLSSLLFISVLLLVLGSFIFFFYSKNYKIGHENLYKLCFVIIVCFGLFNVFLTPIADVCDETEHFWRAEITSTGQFNPEYVSIPNTNDSGYQTISSLTNLYHLTGNTVFNNSWGTQPIDYNVGYVSSAFSQNPFYGYLAQAFGIDIAKFLNLSNIWMLWLGRICNLLLYAGFASLAIKKAPIFKVPLLVVACLPLAVYQGASMSIDAFVNGSSLLPIGYFLYLYKSEDLTWKNVSIFFLLSIFGGLTKVTYLALSFLIFLVPRANFKTKNDYIFSRLGILIVIFVSYCWSSFYATPNLLNSWRGPYFMEHNVNASGQIHYLLHNNLGLLNFIGQLPFTLFTVIEGYFSFANLPAYGSKLLAYLYIVFFFLVSLFYPVKVKFDRFRKIGVFLIFLLTYFGIIFIQYLTWCSVAYHKIVGIFGRYFIPLLSLIPLFLSINVKESNKSIDLSVLVCIFFFLASSILLTVFQYY